MQTKTRTTAVPGTHWILPRGQQTPVGEPNRLLFVHVIPQNVAYQLLLDTDVVHILKWNISVEEELVLRTNQ